MKARKATLSEPEIVTRKGKPVSVIIPTPTVGVRHEGEAIVLEPLKSKTWPEGFFDSIHITDPAFSRPNQGQLPPVKPL